MKTILIIVCGIGLCVSSNAVAGGFDSTRVGVYVTSIYDLDYINNSFTVKYWLWRVNNQGDPKEYYIFETMNSKDLKTVFSSATWKDQSENITPTEKGDTIFWDYDEFTGVFRHEYDIGNYPFDQERLIMEFVGLTTSYNLKIDTEQSGQGSLSLKGWEIGKMEIDTFSIKHATNFGSPGDTTRHHYSGFKVTIPIKRQSFFLFVKLFTGLLVSFVIALFSLRINISEADGRFGVCVGSLFAALANMYIVNSNLPILSQFSYVDQVHIVTAFVILALFITSTVSLKYYRAGNENKSKKLDRHAFYLTLIFYAVVNAFMLINAAL